MLAGLERAGLFDLLPHRVLAPGASSHGSAILAAYPLRELQGVEPPGYPFVMPRADIAVPGAASVEAVSVHPVPPTGPDAIDTWEEGLGALPATSAGLADPSDRRLQRHPGSPRRSCGYRAAELAARSPARGPRRGPRPPRRRRRAARGRAAPPRRSPRPTGGSSPAAPRSATRRRRATRPARTRASPPRSASPPGWRNETMPPKPGQRTSLTPVGVAQELAHDAAVVRVGGDAQVEGPQAAVDEEAVERPGDRADRVLDEADPLVEPGSATISAPPTVSEWPLRYFVVECITAPAPSSSGRCTTGVAKVLSTQTRASPDALDDGRDVDDVQERVGGGLDPDELRLRPHRARRPRPGRSGRRGRRRGPSARAPCRPAGTCRRRGRPGGSRGRRRRRRR